MTHKLSTTELEQLQQCSDDDLCQLIETEVEGFYHPTATLLNAYVLLREGRSEHEREGQ